MKKDNEKIFKYVTCGDLSGYDEDLSSDDDSEDENALEKESKN